MVEPERQVFAIRRFLPRVVPLAIGAAVVWNYTQDWNAGFTIGIVKFLHELAGRPTPYMFCDEQRMFWHATMFPPVVALTLGSYWLGWGDRLVRTGVGYVAHCAMTAIAITIHESPYLQSTPLLNPVTSTLVNANYLTFGVVIWVSAAGPWYARPARAEGALGRRAWMMVRRGWLTRVVLLVLGVATVVPAFALLGTKEGMAARRRVAEAMRAVPFFPQPSTADVAVTPEEQLARDKAVRKALLAIQKAIEADVAAELGGGALFYLTSHLFLSMRPDDEAAVRMFRNRALLAYEAAKKYRTR